MNATISDNLPKTIYFSELRLRQILFNLVGNAIKFTDNGNIIISAHCKHLDPDDKIDLFITIEDTGIGIPKNELQKIFEPFNQSKTNKTKQGTGLGLTITKRLVKLMNGTIDIVSQENVGTKFSICFPKISVSKNIVIEHSKLIPVIEKNKFVNAIVLTNNITKCKIQNIEGINELEKDIAANLEKVRSVFKEKNLIIICGLSLEKSRNALNILLKSETSHKVRFIIISETKADEKSNNNVTWLDNSISNKEFAKLLNITFNKIAFEEKSNFYFHDLISFKNNIKFNEKLDIIYDRSFKLALKTKLSLNIESFIESLEQLADEFISKGLKNYCSDLKIEITSFNIEEIDKLLNLFKTNYQLNNK